MYIYSSLLAYGNCKPVNYFSYCHTVLSESVGAAVPLTAFALVPVMTNVPLSDYCDCDCCQPVRQPDSRAV